MFNTFKCENCGRGHETLNALKMHRSRHHNAKEMVELQQSEEIELAVSEHSADYDDRPGKAMDYLRKAIRD